ncbi:hypothetical protein ACFYT4_25830 [Streptomyces sp. NPDC004609]|uniref:hypothetical protein n=1 Tax=Streptomyces sp. NPDC004609 TaxID=3364704 RepID=UPI0036A7D758
MEKIYLSDVEIHRQSPIARAEDLRARVLFHVLLSDVLLIGDSQCLNTPLFRALVSPDEGDASVRSDLGQLLDGGRIRVARRDGQPLPEVRASQVARGVEHAPSEAYARETERRTAAHAVAYDLGSVAAAFKSGVLRLMDGQVRTAEGETRATLEAAREFMAGQEPLFYKGIRDWADSYQAASGHRSTEVVLALGAVDRAAGEAYRQALPTVLGAGTAAPRSTRTQATAPTNRTLLERAGLPAGMLDGFLLGRLPVEVLLEATEQASRRAVVQEFALLRRGDSPDPARLAEAMTEFSAWMQEAFARAFGDTDERARAVLEGRRNLMRFGISEDSVTGALGAGLDVPAALRNGDGDGDTFLDLRVVDRSVPAADGAAGIEELEGRQLRQRVITGSYGG